MFGAVQFPMRVIGNSSDYLHQPAAEVQKSGVYRAAERVYNTSIVWTTLSTSYLLLCGTVTVLVPNPVSIGMTCTALTLLSWQIANQWRRIFFEAVVSYEMALVKIMPSHYAWSTHVDDDLILSAIPCEEHDVAAVVDMTTKQELLPRIHIVPVSEEQYRLKGTSYLRLEVPDLCPVSVEKIEEGVQFLLKARRNTSKPVLVNCKSGRQRSAVVAAAYLLKTRDHMQTVQQAVAYLKKRRPQVSPTQGQLRELSRWLEKYN